MDESASLPPRRGVVGVVIRDGRFLVIRRSQHVRAPGMHCFPGGAIEAGETEVEALKREMFEELGVIAEPRRLLWRSVTPWNVHLTWFITEIAGDAEPVANPLEVESVAWLTADEFRGLAQVLASNLEFLDAWERGAFVSASRTDPFSAKWPLRLIGTRSNGDSAG